MLKTASTRVSQWAAPGASPAPAAGTRGASTGGPTWSVVVSDYLNLTKPRITLLNLVTTFAALWSASGGRPGWQLAAATLAGTALAVAAGGVLNCWVERERDGLMERTRRRPLPAGRLQPEAALRFGLVLAVAGVAVLALWTTPLAAAIAGGGILFYAWVYTALLKPRTHWNTVLGGLAGSVPPLIGWSAVTGGLNAQALAVTALVFAWQPVHFWALALLHTDDYRRAGIKMLPVTHGPAATRRQILLWTVLLLGASIAVYALDLAGYVYLAGALGFGAWLLVLAVRNLRDEGLATAARLFHTSNGYLALLYLLLILDSGR